ARALLDLVEYFYVQQAAVVFDLTVSDQPLLRRRLRLLRPRARGPEPRVEEHEAARECRHETNPGRANSHKISFSPQELRSNESGRLYEKLFRDFQPGRPRGPGRSPAAKASEF